MRNPNENYDIKWSKKMKTTTEKQMKTSETVTEYQNHENGKK
jgi:hypothetical protein